MMGSVRPFSRAGTELNQVWPGYVRLQENEPTFKGYSPILSMQNIFSSYPTNFTIIKMTEMLAALQTSVCEIQQLYHYINIDHCGVLFKLDYLVVVCQTVLQHSSEMCTRARSLLRSVKGAQLVFCRTVRIIHVRAKGLTGAPFPTVSIDVFL